MAFGDSLTYGYNVPREDTYPAQLSRELGKPIINLGISGHTIADGLRRVESELLPLEPSVVLLCLGGNDILRRNNPDNMRRDLSDIIERIQRTGALVVLIGIEGDGFIYPGGQGDMYRELAEQHGCVYVPDILDGIVGKPSLMVDKIHANGAGYSVMVEKILHHAGDYITP